MIRTESNRQKEAFEYYYAMDKRILSVVARVFEVTIRTVYKWSHDYNWIERVSQRDIEINKKLQEKVVNTVVNEKANYRKMVKLTVGKLLEDIREGSVDYKVADLDKLIRLDMYLMGESESSIKINGEVSMNEEDKALIKELSVSMNEYVDELGEG